VAAPLLLLAGGSPPNPELQIRRGNEAFAAGDFQSSLDSYTAAEEQATDPGLVAFNKAAALYEQGRYREAELHYRRCAEDANGQRRQRMLYGLANCLCLEARSRDVARLHEAVRRYEECLEGSSLPDDLKDDANHNLELARILLAKAKEQ